MKPKKTALETVSRLLRGGMGCFLLVAILPGQPLEAGVRADVQRALDVQHELVEKRPHRSGLWNDLGNLLVLADRVTEAEEAYRRSLEIAPDSITTRYNLALLFQETGRARKSRRALKQVLKKSPNHAWSHYHLAVAYAETGQRVPAVKHYARAVRLEPRLTDPRYNPHILDNHLAAHAVLVAYSDLPAAELAPRLYQNRTRIVETMIGADEDSRQLPEMEPAAVEGAETTAEAAEPEPRKQRKARRQRKRKREDG